MLKIPILLSLQKLYNLYCHNNGSTNAQQICLQFTPMNYFSSRFSLKLMLWLLIPNIISIVSVNRMIPFSYRFRQQIFSYFR